MTLSLRAAPELAGLPWEFLYDYPRFLAQQLRTPVVRFVDLEDPPQPLRVEPPLQILGMVSRPRDDDLAELDAEQEQANLQRHLAPLLQTGQVRLRWLERATLPALQQEVDHGEDFHIFHYIGHGDYDEDSGDRSLILEHPDRRPHRVGGQQLGTLLCDRGSLRLAVLNACETAQTAPQDPLAGVATSLMEYNVPAVVAMQFAITDDGALTFADEFYRSLADGYSVDAAVTQARRAIAAHSDIEWGTPVLFTRVADGHLFDLQPTGTTDTPDTAQVPASRPQTAPQTERTPITTAAIDAAMHPAVHDDSERLRALTRFAESRLKQDSRMDSRSSSARWLVNEGDRLAQLDRPEEAVAVYDEVIARYGNATEPSLREQVARALVNKGVRLGWLDDSEDELRAYDEVIARFGNATELPLREQVARALINKGDRLGRRPEEAVAVYDEVIARYGNATEPSLRGQVARAKSARQYLRQRG